jgi:hypothetical protein
VKVLGFASLNPVYATQSTYASAFLPQSDRPFPKPNQRIRSHNKAIAGFSTEDRVPDLFEAIVLNMGDLPSARRTLKPKMSKKPSMQTVPS